MFDTETEGARIELRALTKHYPGQPAPAVDGIDLDIPAGELVVFVGPSGCGKTTTMKMINRLVEPTSGEIRIGGEDVLSLQPDELRRHIGYAIQQVGLFPHLTIGQNIGLVPKLLGWPAARIAARVEELLSLVNLEPSLFHDRYPRQLSGGQQQRVGVARALAADPPVMLMDEPFGATDPITREHLQKEFVRLQKRLRKTIIFVTHDFEEAIKLGDRIVVLRERSHIAQYATPAEILAHPADDYVAGFVGQDATLKRLALLRVEDVTPAGPPQPVGLPQVAAGTSLREALDVMIAHGSDRCSSPSGVLTYAALCGAVGTGRPPSPGREPEAEPSLPAPEKAVAGGR
ncbi:ABC transporter ATP-binding protein [Streptosporangium sp. NPDC004379]|uniref:ABC transporter ATP-binding protein n=1 Tax=Streptosporangium sp. NPDC004379 TaxID=3366189 RepID=UPI0036BC6A2F